MVISIPEEKKKEIIAYIRTFTVPCHRHTSREFQQIVGTVNWLFNVFPLLKLGLSSVYDKMRGKTKPLAQIYVNLDVSWELRWLANHMESMSGCHIPYISRFSSEVPDARSDQIRSTDPYRIHHDKLLHSYPVHITLNTAYFLHLVYPPFWLIGYAFFRLCSTDPFHL
jgi:hypothetical protein